MIPHERHRVCIGLASGCLKEDIFEPFRIQDAGWHPDRPTLSFSCDNDRTRFQIDSRRVDPNDVVIEQLGKRDVYRGQEVPQVEPGHATVDAKGKQPVPGHAMHVVLPPVHPGEVVPVKRRL